MTKIETVLIYVGIPALVIAVVVGLVFAGDTRRGGARRYRPGRPFDFHPVWFLSAAAGDGQTGEQGGDRAALTGAPSRAALTGETRPGPLLAAAAPAGESAGRGPDPAEPDRRRK